jgi:hypothetical protein
VLIVWREEACRFEPSAGDSCDTGSRLGDRTDLVARHDRGE